MFYNHIKIAFRNLFRQKGFASINILGLAVGLTVSLLILLWVQDEGNIDQFHENGDRIFQVYTNIYTGDGGIRDERVCIVDLNRNRVVENEVGSFDSLLPVVKKKRAPKRSRPV